MTDTILDPSIDAAEATQPEDVATATDLSTPVGPATDDVANRLLADLVGAQELFAVYVGDRLGWYRTLAQHGPITAPELARATSTHARYAREWLEHQAATGLLVVDDERAAADARRYHLTGGATEVLTDAASPSFLAPLARLQTAVGRVADDILEAYRVGGGVSWAQYGVDAREAQAHINRPFFLGPLVQDVLPSLPELHARLSAGARVADLGCGEGWSSIAIALAYDAVHVVGVDVDGPSVEAARRHAAAYGVEHRVTFQDADAAGLEREPGVDVVTFFECVHDMPDPVGVLRAARELVDEDGWVIVMDEHTQDEFSAPAGFVDRLFYGYSLTVCLPDSLSHDPSVGTGTVMRPATLEAYARDAGFSGLEVLPVDNELMRFYRLLV